MKIHSKFVNFTIFLLVFCFFLLPPLFINEYNLSQKSISFNSFPLQNVVFFLFSILLYYFYNDAKKINKHYVFYNIIFPFFLCFSLLFFISLVIKSISILSSINSISIIQKPNTFITWFFCILSFSCSAFLEETIYRAYTPFIFNIIFIFIKKEKLKKIIVEFIGLMFFSFAHIYLGIFSVINAFFAHIILRITFIKNKSIFPGFLAHFFYNVISLILL